MDEAISFLAALIIVFLCDILVRLCVPPKLRKVKYSLEMITDSFIEQTLKSDTINKSLHSMIVEK